MHTHIYEIVENYNTTGYFIILKIMFFKCYNGILALLHTYLEIHTEMLWMNLYRFQDLLQKNIEGGEVRKGDE